jgi:hypothetical protein
VQALDPVLEVEATDGPRVAPGRAQHMVEECGDRCCSWSPYVSSNVKEENGSTSPARA